MTLGEKIKIIRKQKGLTQAAIAKNKITRNMLSVIESDKASPSLDTLIYIAKVLEVSPAYLISDSEDVFLFEKMEKINSIKSQFKNKKFHECIEIIEQFDHIDDELEYILAVSYFELGKKAVLGGSLQSGEEYLEHSVFHSNRTIYDTSRIDNSILIYSALVKNIQSPLLELDTVNFENNLSIDFEFDFYKYLIGDTDYKQRNKIFEKHLKAKILIKERRYLDALSLMRSIEEEKTPESYNAYVVFSVYSDMENCYKQLADFENAYRYASKRLSIIEGFKS